MDEVKITARVRNDVRRGAVLLDDLVPGWADKINVKRLRMHDGSYCICGQLAGEICRLAGESTPKSWARWSQAIMGLVVLAKRSGRRVASRGHWGPGFVKTETYGFSRRYRDHPELEGWNHLRAAWLEEIAARKTS